MIYDVLIIGGSFAGLSAAMQLARGRRTVCVIDTGLPRNRFADHSHGFFAHDGDAPLDLIGAGRSKLLAYPNVTFKCGEAIHARREGEGFAVDIMGGHTLLARKLVLAFGVRDHLPDLPGLAERWGESVLHCPYCHGYEFGGGPLGVLSTAPMSSHQAMLIPDWGATIFFLNGGAMPDSETRAHLQYRQVAIEPLRVVALEDAGIGLTGIRLEDSRTIPLRALYLAPRTELNSSIAVQLGCALDDGVFGPVIRVDAMAQTTVPGVFAAGDIARSMHNATFASADGVMAGASAHRSLIFEPLGL
ncbi:NAD(P)/FAD-dependent oxidoreductase [Asticcacaulis sp.]|uniref:NAD(P)/FAD-dependent oxidoreductase n=1 Tax=Asticcacaulis sp. TaxID=1872648 RepID=UPI003F7B7B89